MDSNIIVSELEGGVLWIDIDRPDKKNALTVQMYRELIAALDRLENEETWRVAVLASRAPRCFTSGNDLKDFMTPGADLSVVVSFLKRLASLTKPLICAVNGIAIGVGTTLLLHADLVYADERATFRLPFVELALVPEAASSLLLPQTCGMTAAGRMLLAAETLSAAQAQELGLVVEVCPAGVLLPLVAQKARALAQKPPQALKATKQLMRDVSRHAVEQTMHREAQLFATQLRSPEFMKAASALMQKRK